MFYLFHGLLLIQESSEDSLSTVGARVKSKTEAAAPVHKNNNLLLSFAELSCSALYWHEANLRFDFAQNLPVENLLHQHHHHHHQPPSVSGRPPLLQSPPRVTPDGINANSCPIPRQAVAASRLPCWPGLSPGSGSGSWSAVHMCWGREGRRIAQTWTLLQIEDWGRCQNVFSSGLLHHLDF